MTEEEQKPTINKAQVLSALKADLKSAEQLKLQMDSSIQGWRDAYDGKPYGNEVEGKSAIVSQDIKRQSAWQHAALVDPFVSTADVIKCHPVTAEDATSARQNELLLNTQFCRKFDRFNFVSRAIKVLDRDGTVFVQTGWDYQEEVVEAEEEVLVEDENGVPSLELQVVKNIRTVVNKPTAKVCRNEDIYLDRPR